MYYEYTYKIESGEVVNIGRRPDHLKPTKKVRWHKENNLDIFVSDRLVTGRHLHVVDGELVCDAVVKLSTPAFPKELSSIVLPTITSETKTIIFYRARKGIGDIVSTLSAVQSMKKKYPDKKIIYVTIKPFDEILAHHPNIDEIIIKGESYPPDGASVVLDYPCPCGEYETVLGDKTDKSRNEIFTLASGLNWNKEKPILYLTDEEMQWGQQFTSTHIKADYHVHVAEDDGIFNPDEWVLIAEKKGLSIVGVNTHCNVRKAVELTKELNLLPGNIIFIPVTEIEIKDDTRKFHLLCVNPVSDVTDCSIADLHILKPKCDKLILAHPKFDFTDFAHLLDGFEVENGRHKCEFKVDGVTKYKGSDAHKLIEWANCDLFTLVKSENNLKPNLGIVLRTAEFWKDWPHTLDFIDLCKDEFNVYAFDKSETVEGCINVAGYSLREVMSILPYMDIVVTPDTGIMHLCDGLDVPVLALFGSMCAQVHKLKYDSSVSFIQGSCPHSKIPCWYQICSGKGNFQDCLTSIKPELVLEKVKSKIATGTIDNVRLFR